jgi:hypothetical protein
MSCTCASTGRRSGRGAVGADRGLDGIERRAHRGVADGVHVNLEAVRVDSGDDGYQGHGLPDEHAAVGAPAAGIRVEQRRGAAFDDTVGEQLHGVGGQQRVAALAHPVTQSHEPVNLLRPAARVGVQGEVDGGVQPLLCGCGEVGLDVVGLDPGVLHPGDPERGQVGGGFLERAHPDVEGVRARDVEHEVDRAPLAQRAERRSVGASGDLTERRGGRRGVDAGEVQRRRVDPHRVVVGGSQHHGSVGHGLVEPPGVEQPVGRERRVVGRPADPRLVRVLGRPARDLRDDLGDRPGIRDVWSMGLQAREHRVGVPVTERRDEDAVTHLDHSGTGRVREGERSGIHGNDEVTADRDRVEVALHRAPDAPVKNRDQVSGLGARTHRS